MRHVVSFFTWIVNSRDSENQMKNKFVIVDQSIKDAGGHHLEYAKRVLKAAKSAGFTTVLAVHRDCEDIKDSNIDVLEKAFSHTFWENVARERQVVRKRGTSIFGMLRDKKDDLIYDIVFSQLGIAYQLIMQGRSPRGLAAKYSIVSADQRISKLAFFAGAILVRLRGVANQAKRPLAVVGSVFGKPGQLIFRFFKFIVAVLLSPLIAVHVLLRWKSSVNKVEHFYDLFAQECDEFLTRLQVSRGDLVFVPTLGIVEMMGIAACSRNRAFDGLHWHLLFRRDLFKGREPSYMGQMDSVQPTRIAFSEFKQTFRYGKAFFYTDTDSLTEQYNTLGAYVFKTLPIPLDDSLGRTDKPRQALVVSYIGDAREEKGFPNLPRLVADIRAAGFDETEVTFVFQSNFNIPEGEPGVCVAKAELAAHQSHGVDLRDGPFSSEEYTRMVNNSDIILVPYNSEQYYARSSGIFAEALVAGVPTVYPRMSWMGRELQMANQEYLEILEVQAAQGKSIDLLEHIKGRADLFTIRTGKSGNALIFMFQLQAPAPGRFARILLRRKTRFAGRKSDKKEVFELCGTAFIDLRVGEGRAVILGVPDGTYSCQVEEVDASPSTDVDLRFLFAQFRCRRIKLGSNVPTQVVSVGFDGDDEISAAVLQLVRHYDLYARSCQAVSPVWRRYHSSAELVAILQNADKQ